MFVFLAMTVVPARLCAEPLAEETEISITCQLMQAPSIGQVPVFAMTKECEECKGTYHYKLWLPKGYNAAPQRRWPCMFMASAGGNAKMGQMAGWLKANRYIVVMLVESKNGPWAPIIGNFLAAHDDVVNRVRIQEGLKFATGMSGGARASSMFVQLRAGFCGLILQGAGAAYDPQNRYAATGLRQNAALYIAMTVGRKDNNFGEANRMKNLIPSNRFFAVEFDGGHVWAPADVFGKAITWTEQCVYDTGTTNPVLRPIYLTRFGVLADKCVAATTPEKRSKAAEAALAYARLRNLAGDPAVAAQLAALRTGKAP